MSFQCMLETSVVVCPAADVMARRFTPECRQQKNFCRRSCCVCVEQHILSAVEADMYMFTDLWNSEKINSGLNGSTAVSN